MRAFTLSRHLGGVKRIGYRPLSAASTASGDGGADSNDNDEGEDDKNQKNKMEVNEAKAMESKGKTFARRQAVLARRKAAGTGGSAEGNKKERAAPPPLSFGDVPIWPGDKTKNINSRDLDVMKLLKDMQAKHKLKSSTASMSTAESVSTIRSYLSQGLSKRDPQAFIKALDLATSNELPDDARRRMVGMLVCAQSYLLYTCDEYSKAQVLVEPIYWKMIDECTGSGYNIEALGVSNDYALLQMHSGNFHVASAVLVDALTRIRAALTTALDDSSNQYSYHMRGAGGGDGSGVKYADSEDFDSHTEKQHFLQKFIKAVEKIVDRQQSARGDTSMFRKISPMTGRWNGDNGDEAFIPHPRSISISEKPSDWMPEPGSDPMPDPFLDVAGTNNKSPMKQKKARFDVLEDGRSGWIAGDDKEGDEQHKENKPRHEKDMATDLDKWFADDKCKDDNDKAHQKEHALVDDIDKWFASHESDDGLRRKDRDDDGSDDDDEDDEDYDEEDESDEESHSEIESKLHALHNEHVAKHGAGNWGGFHNPLTSNSSSSSSSSPQIMIKVIQIGKVPGSDGSDPMKVLESVQNAMQAGEFNGSLLDSPGGERGGFGGLSTNNDNNTVQFGSGEWGKPPLEYLNYFFAITSSHLAEVCIRCEDYSSALDLLEDAWTALGSKGPEDASALHLSVCVRINLTACMRKLAASRRGSLEVEGGKNEKRKKIAGIEDTIYGESMLEGAVRDLDANLPTSLQYGLVHHAAYVNLAIAKLSEPTVKRAAQSYALASRALLLAETLPKSLNLHCVPPLLLQAASCTTRDEALECYKRVKTIAEAATTLPKQQQEIILAVVAHNRKQLARPSDEVSVDGDGDDETLVRYVQDGMVEEVRVPCNGSIGQPPDGDEEQEETQRLFVMGQSAQVMGLHIDGGMWNLPWHKKSELLKSSRWVFGTQFKDGGKTAAFGQ